MASELKHCPFCSKTMMLRSALWPSEGDADAIIHADPTDCPMLGFSDGSADGSIIEKWNCSLSNEDDFPSDGSCVRCGSVPRNANGLCNTCLDEDAERLENTRPSPVAPVSPNATGKCGELVTVAQIDTGRKWRVHFLTRPVRGEELVTRSQAEELLAAERAETERWQSIAKTRWQKLGKALADNAALTARIDVLESLRPHWAKGYSSDSIAAQAATTALTELWKILGASNQTEAVSKVVALEAKLAAAEKDVATWKANFWDLSDKTARAAMGGKPS
ncbi:hypothetical protein [Brucella tritici]|uniref:hypothetical protein n=1 Tax=Brucella tritici TaxID=94626 RepID=UPI003D6CD74C